MKKFVSRQLALAIVAIIAGVVIRVDGEKSWWQTTTIYQIWPRSFKDSDGDGIGDLNGITSKLEYLSELGIDTIWISPCFKSPQADSGYDVSDYLAIESAYGTMDDFDNLVARAKELGIKVILDYVPNHTSTQHEWFKLSEESVDPYTDYYMWHEGTLDANGTRQPPNNWKSIFNTGSAWEWSDKRQAYYLHQFEVRQADVNLSNSAVLEETKDILTFWMDRGVAGFRIDATPYLFEDPQLRDEPESGLEGYNSSDYSYLRHIYTKDYIEIYPLIQMWRDHLDEYTAKANDGLERIICTEAYANISMISLYYDYGSHVPFNFFLIASDSISFTKDNQTPRTVEESINVWLDNMPEGGTPNWVIGNHDRPRVASRFGSEKLDTLNFLLLLLPGVMTVYNGDEIGMTDTYLTWEETVEPRACSLGITGYAEVSRDPMRTPFQWDNSTSAGFSTNSTTFLKVNENYLTLNLEAQKAADKSYYKNFKGAMKLRNTTVAKDGNLTVRVIDENVFAISRELDGHDPLLVVANWVNSSVTISLDDFSNFSDDLNVLLSSVDFVIEVGSTVSRSNISLPPYAALVLTSSDTSYSDLENLSKSVFAYLLSALRSLFNL